MSAKMDNIPTALGGGAVTRQQRTNFRDAAGLACFEVRELRITDNTNVLDPTEPLPVANGRKTIILVSNYRDSVS